MLVTDKALRRDCTRSGVAPSGHPATLRLTRRCA